MSTIKDDLYQQVWVFVGRMYRKYGPHLTRVAFRRLRSAHWANAGVALDTRTERAPLLAVPTNKDQLIASITDILCLRSPIVIEQLMGTMDDQAAELKAEDQTGAFQVKEVR